MLREFRCAPEDGFLSYTAKLSAAKTLLMIHAIIIQPSILRGKFELNFPERKLLNKQITEQLILASYSFVIIITNRTCIFKEAIK